MISATDIAYQAYYTLLSATESDPKLRIADDDANFGYCKDPDERTLYELGHGGVNWHEESSYVNSSEWKATDPRRLNESGNCQRRVARAIAEFLRQHEYLKEEKRLVTDSKCSVADLEGLSRVLEPKVKLTHRVRQIQLRSDRIHGILRSKGFPKGVVEKIMNEAPGQRPDRYCLRLIELLGRTPIWFGGCSGSQVFRLKKAALTENRYPENPQFLVRKASQGGGFTLEVRLEGNGFVKYKITCDHRFRWTCNLQIEKESKPLSFASVEGLINHMVDNGSLSWPNKPKDPVEDSISSLDASVSGDDISFEDNDECDWSDEYDCSAELDWNNENSYQPF